MLIKVCQGPGCGREFEAKRPHARFCSGRCSKRAQRAPSGAAQAARKRPTRRAQLRERTEAWLRGIGQLGSAHGHMAVLLAQDIDQAHDTGAGAGALVPLARAYRQAVDRLEADRLEAERQGVGRLVIPTATAGNVVALADRKRS